MNLSSWHKWGYRKCYNQHNAVQKILFLVPVVDIMSRISSKKRMVSLLTVEVISETMEKLVSIRLFMAPHSTKTRKYRYVIHCFILEQFQYKKLMLTFTVLKCHKTQVNNKVFFQGKCLYVWKIQNNYKTICSSKKDLHREVPLYTYLSPKHLRTKAGVCMLASVYVVAVAILAQCSNRWGPLTATSLHTPLRFNLGTLWQYLINT